MFLFLVGCAILVLGSFVGLCPVDEWHPKARWFGWRDLHAFWRGTFGFIALRLLLDALPDRPHGFLEGVVFGLIMVQGLFGIIAVVGLLRWAINAHLAYDLLRKMGLTDSEIGSLYAVDENSEFEELMSASSGLRKLASRVAAVFAAFNSHFEAAKSTGPDSQNSSAN